MALAAIGSALLDFYPRPPRGGRHVLDSLNSLGKSISIHALREEGDARNIEVEILRRISIHALREEGDTTPKTTAPEGG